ncbi:thiamine pyrophosphate-binding protein [Paenibacillus tepidiphilus]|uniref:thiamine pyrophosphate-binding protein n=1 Tax=Paenibacillus tepidiphilus TaxID=2608683 RepID=UPI0012389E89|nr:thiamine pyrophosphate-binding protein [Paenibacillus tepidiphilus]
MVSGLNGSTILAQSLKLLGVEQAFGVVGLVASSLIDALCNEGIEYIGARHEASAVYMADSWIQVTRRVAVCILPGAPGVTNAVSGIVRASLANTPLLVIIGTNVSTKNDRGNLQDMKCEPMLSEYVKDYKIVPTAERIPEYVRMVCKKMLAGRPGPVCLEIPFEVQLSRRDSGQYDLSIVQENRLWNKSVAVEEDIVSLAGMLVQSDRPVIIGGSGVWWSYAEHEVCELSRLLEIPYFGISLARGVVPDDNELSMGVGSPMTSTLTHYAFANADLIVAIGARFNFALAFGNEPYYGSSERQAIVQIDIEPGELNANKMNLKLGLVGDAKETLKALLRQLGKLDCRKRSRDWVSDLISLKEEEQLMLQTKSESQGQVHPYDVMQSINSLSGRGNYFVRDGSHAGQWLIKHLRVFSPGRVLSSPNGTLGLMGAGLPMAIGIKAAYPQEEVVLYTGDGSFGFHIGEIQTAIQYNLKIIIIIHNNSAWGSCKFEQRNTFNMKAYRGVELPCNAYHEVVKAFGGEGVSVRTVEEFNNAYQTALASTKTYCINVELSECNDVPDFYLMDIHKKTL